MRAISDIILYAITSISALVFDFGIIYSQQGRFKPPLIICGVLVSIIGVLTTMALYQTIKHRKDKEPW